jgi:ankyrin repeat protein
MKEADLRKMSKGGPGSTDSSTKDDSTTPEEHGDQASIGGAVKAHSDVHLSGLLPPTPFLQLAKCQRFDEIMHILDMAGHYDLDAWLFLTMNTPSRRSKMSRSVRHDKALEELTSLHQFKGETALHMIVYYKPAVLVVDKLIRYLSATTLTVPEEVLDVMGRTPLHVAAANACPPMTMARLVSGVSGVMPAVTKDYMGRHPLHWACTNPHGIVNIEQENRSTKSFFSRLICGHRVSSDQDNDMSAVDNMVQVVFLLLKAYPEAVAIADDEGNTPLSLAFAHHADPRILKLLQEAGHCFKQIYSPYMTEMNRTQTNGSYSEEEFPVEVTESSDDADYPDDISSIGSCGVSLYNRKVKRPISDKRGTRGSWALRVTKIEEAVEL